MTGDCTDPEDSLFSDAKLAEYLERHPEACGEPEPKVIPEEMQPRRCSRCKWSAPFHAADCSEKLATTEARRAYAANAFTGSSDTFATQERLRSIGLSDDEIAEGFERGMAAQRAATVRRAVHGDPAYGS